MISYEKEVNYHNLTGNSDMSFVDMAAPNIK